ncbi:Maf-like protein YhdE [Caulifigura coniformis]|uniref:dTTP/UTP pyrophosphatase n=1 Tax=Caulifigura coniformis TaxID=2527983 RepID=A0A517SH53_9PLAN|nr:Maf family protein [Caulifigura coniformis]QDT55455.1 Maf-like protein YhdE [Caulifigura coniformis]
MNNAPLILASRSPRRSELLGLLVRPERIVIRPPASADEPGFDDCQTINAVQDRLLEIARMKRVAVRSESSDLPDASILAADTTIVAESRTGDLAVLGQPPRESPSRPTVRRWFDEFYFHRPHVAMTAVTIERADGRTAECIAVTTVSFNRSRADWLDWYLSTSEPDGKAGGYAIQGLASMFVDRIEGSLTNVVGLPLAETRQLLLDMELV